MSYIPFDKLIDKATERELVYDIVERLSLGKPMYNELNSLYYEANTMVTDGFKKIIKMLPPDIEADYSKIQVANMEIPAGSKSGICRFNDLTIGKVVLAYSQQTQMDIKQLINTTGDTTALTCTFTADVPYINDEVIKIYAY